MRLIPWNGFSIRADNVPLKLPGVYRFTCLVNGKPYVGISQDVFRRCRHHGENSPTKFRNAIRKYGRMNFLCEPLFYWTDGKPDRSFLATLEAELIASHNSVAKGYNIAERSEGGSYGPEFSISQKAGWVERRERQRLNPKPPSPKYRETAIRLKSDPDYLAAHAAARPRMSAGAKKAGLARAANQTPERLSEIGRMGGLAGGHNGAVAQRAKMSPEQIREMCSNGGRTNAKKLADDPDHREAVSATCSASAKAYWDELRADPVAYRARRERHKVADHSSPQARENYRRAALLREAKRRTARELTI